MPKLPLIVGSFSTEYLHYLIAKWYTPLWRLSRNAWFEEYIIHLNVEKSKRLFRSPNFLPAKLSGYTFRKIHLKQRLIGNIPFMCQNFEILDECLRQSN